ncbi:hypothetical protein BS50DRAFT_629230 [Corynespora cassiicola Philippines]|uniref:Uncharacterized protein n=1 Tax=Corynespora cassiicola Philippines TaxID=1448308 RepID=A0A2T2P649_CORCC|nr:hypothetical protein BS50DRAFT_629230 [Corynespora cassiicola Philippines]
MRTLPQIKWSVPPRPLPKTWTQFRIPSSCFSSASYNNQDSSSQDLGNEAKTKEGSSPEGGKKKKTLAELDKELEMKMKGLAGDGGEAGVEMEDGQPVSMKRSVRNNMFRYI